MQGMLHSSPRGSFFEIACTNLYRFGIECTLWATGGDQEFLPPALYSLKPLIVWAKLPEGPTHSSFVVPDGRGVANGGLSRLGTIACPGDRRGVSANRPHGFGLIRLQNLECTVRSWSRTSGLQSFLRRSLDGSRLGKGGWSVYPLASNDDPRTIVGEPHGHCFFAGEYLAAAYGTTMEGRPVLRIRGRTGAPATADRVSDAGRWGVYVCPQRPLRLKA
jgi:hypothetical protein